MVCLRCASVLALGLGLLSLENFLFGQFTIAQITEGRDYSLTAVDNFLTLRAAALHGS